MRHFLPYCMLALAIASCGAPEQPQAAPPTMAALPPTIVSPLPTIAPTTTLHPSPPPTTPLLDTAYPVFPIDDLLFQPGDLPDANLTTHIEHYLVDWGGMVETAASNGATLFLEQNPQKHDYGSVIVYFYKKPDKIKDDYNNLLSFLSDRADQLPQQGIGDKAILLRSNHEGAGYSLIFTLCHMTAIINLQSPADQQTILTYGTRLAQRIDAVDCKHATHAPLQTPAPITAAATPIPTAAVVAHSAVQMTLLPDTSCIWSICAYTFVDIDHGWLALGGTIMATSDGGANWHEQYRTDSRVKAITFVSSQRGWITMEHGYVLTEDGGATWQPATTSPNYDGKHASQPTHLDICSAAGDCASLNSQIGWALGFNENDSYSDAARLLKTKDGGKSWQIISDRDWDQPDKLPRVGSDYQLFFMDEQHGWFSNTTMWNGMLDITDSPSLYATTDGGHSWHVVATSVDKDAPIKDVLFLSPIQGFAMSSFNDRATLFHINGTDWQPIYTVPPSTPFPYLATPFFFSDGSGIGVSVNSTFIRTTDSGANWTKVGAINNDCGPVINDVSKLNFVDPQHGWATRTCGSMPQPGLYQTSDGGVTWTAINSPGTADNPLVDVSFVDSQTGYIVLNSGQLQRTDDGGMTWTAIPSDLVHTANLLFVTRDTGWELRGHQLFATHDGGNTWTPIGLDAPTRLFWLLPDRHAWALADGGDYDHPATRLFTTADGGQTWSESELPGITLDQHTKGEDKITIQFIDDNHGWLQVDMQLYTTQDGGQSWVQLH